MSAEEQLEGSSQPEINPRALRMLGITAAAVVVLNILEQLASGTGFMEHQLEAWFSGIFSWIIWPLWALSAVLSLSALVFPILLAITYRKIKGSVYFVVFAALSVLLQVVLYMYQSYFFGENYNPFMLLLHGLFVALSVLILAQGLRKTKALPSPVLWAAIIWFGALLLELIAQSPFGDLGLGFLFWRTEWIFPTLFYLAVALGALAPEVFTKSFNGARDRMR